LEVGEISAALIRGALMFLIVLGLATIVCEFDRRVRCAGGRRFRGRNGFVQVLADVMKLMSKSSSGGKSAVASVGACGPLGLAAAFAVIAAVPLAPAVSLAGIDFQLTALRLDSGVSLSLAMMSLWVLAALMSNIGLQSKGAFLDALRLASTYLGIFLVVCFSLVSLVMMAGSMDIDFIVASQGGPIWNWYAAKQPLAFVLFSISIFAMSDAPSAFRTADGAQGSPRIGVAGAGMKLALARMSSCVFMVACSSLCAALFLGGWQIPFVEAQSLGGLLGAFTPTWAVPLSLMAIGFLVMLAKTIAMFLIAAWVRVSVPSMTANAMLQTGWRYMLPIAMANALATAAVMSAL